MAFIRGKLKRKNTELTGRIEILEERLKIATDCLEKISEGNFELGLDNADQNMTDEESKNFILTLSKMNDQLKKYSENERERIWVAEGMARFMNLVQGDNRGRDDFYDTILSMIVNYLDVNQGGLFILNDADPQDSFLEMSACYAYGKKKFNEKKIRVGEGILGQCFLEKETSQLTKIPASYATITSGLGEATPGYLILVPMKYDEVTLGVIELASFHPLMPYKIEFIERIAENIASLVLNIRSSNRADHLFKESQEKAKILQEKEEMLRQNLEELVTTQEEMKRNQSELDRQTDLLRFILDNIPFPVFVKDEKGRYSLVNKAEAKLFNMDYKNLLGKDDSHFVNNVEEWNVIRESDEKVLSADEPVELPLQYFTTTQGSSYVFKTTKIPFLNNVTGKKNILGVSIDLTEKLILEKKLFHEKNMSSTNALLNIIGRQRMLSQKIGFHAEALVRGKKQNKSLLQDAIELHEHSLQIIRYGGMPMGVICESPLPKAEKELLPFIEKIEKIWDGYKKAAESIILNSTIENHFASRNEQAIEKSIEIIEQNGELILRLNNDLMLACIEHSQTKLTEIY